ncbi:hypothetical protein QVA66_04000 [Staphylococcus chromogenes]|nr:hypothetical protein [Staphylococcus chromogenes]
MNRNFNYAVRSALYGVIAIIAAVLVGFGIVSPEMVDETVKNLSPILTVIVSAVAYRYARPQADLQDGDLPVVPAPTDPLVAIRDEAAS